MVTSQSEKLSLPQMVRKAIVALMWFVIIYAVLVAGVFSLTICGVKHGVDRESAIQVLTLVVTLLSIYVPVLYAVCVAIMIKENRMIFKRLS